MTKAASLSSLAQATVPTQTKGRSLLLLHMPTVDSTVSVCLRASSAFAAIIIIIVSRSPCSSCH